MKIGTKVTWTRRNGSTVNGKTLAAPEVRGKGEYIQVTETDDKGKPTGKPTFVRPSELKKR